MPWGSCPCPGVEMRGSPPLAPPLCVCGDVYLTVPYLMSRCLRYWTGSFSLFLQNCRVNLRSFLVACWGPKLPAEARARLLGPRSCEKSEACVTYLSPTGATLRSFKKAPDWKKKIPLSHSTRHGTGALALTQVKKTRLRVCRHTQHRKPVVFFTSSVRRLTHGGLPAIGDGEYRTDIHRAPCLDRLRNSMP